MEKAQVETIAADEKAEASEENKVAIYLKGIQTPVVVIDSEFNVTYINQFGRKMLGMKKDAHWARNATTCLKLMTPALKNALALNRSTIRIRRLHKLPRGSEAPRYLYSTLLHPCMIINAPK